MKTKIENFNDLVDAAGLTFAIICCFDRLPEDYFSSLSFKQWMKIYKDEKEDIPLGHKIKKMALKNILELATTVEEWFSIHNSVPQESEIALRKIAQMTLAFEKWSWVYDHSYFGSSLRQLALERMSEMAETLEQWIRVRQCAHSTGLEIKEKTASKKILELTSSITLPQPPFLKSGPKK
jgi:hypothetical protein